MAPRKDSDEYYIIDLCDEVLGQKASRQHTFSFLRGDGTPGRRLPVDAYYPELNLVVEYRERQHTESVPFFDRKTTISGVSRDEQRRIYDQRRRDVLPMHGIQLVEISFSDLQHDSRKRLLRDRQNDLEVVRKMLRPDAADSTQPQRPTSTMQAKVSAVAPKDGTQTWIYRAYRKLGCLLVFLVMPATFLLTLYLSVCVFHLSAGAAALTPFAVMVVVGYICYHYTTGVDARLQEKRNQERARRLATRRPAGPVPVCCPQCGSHHIGPTDSGTYACMDCGIRWAQTFDY